MKKNKVIKINKRNRTIALVAFGLSVALFSSAGIYLAVRAEDTLLQKHVENRFNPADIVIAVEENGDDNKNPENTKDIDWTQNGENYFANKSVKITNVNQKNKNNATSYIKVSFIPHWETTVELDVSSTEKIDVDVDALGGIGNSTLSGITFNKDGRSYTFDGVTYILNKNWSDNWIYNKKDGAFYYKYPVAPGEKTEELLNSISIAKNTKDNIYQDKKLVLDVISDAIQADGGAVEERWSDVGIAIDIDTKKLVLN